MDMSGIGVGDELHSQLEEFLSEVDSINPLVDDNLSGIAPSCEWVVRVDPFTKLSTYQHIRSGQISVTMPEEYKDHLSTFVGGSDEDVSLSRTDHGPSTSSEKKQQKSENMNGSTGQHVDEHGILPGISGYDDSSEEDSVQDSQACLVSVMESHSPLQGTSSPDQCIDPSLPAPSEENRLPATTSGGQSFIGPVLPSDNVSTKRRSPLPTWMCQNQPRKPTKLVMERSARTLLDQFTALNCDANTLNSLQIRYIQLATRFEDWHCGKLSSNYFWKKLQEAEAELKDYATACLPQNWSCHWDRSSKQFYYQNHSDATSQWERPTEQPKMSKKREKRKSRVKLVEYDILDQQSWLDSSPKPEDSQQTTDVVMSPHSGSDRSMSSPPNTLCKTDYNKTEAYQDVSRAKKAYLISQLAEFELACQQLEKELDFSRETCTIVYDPIDPPRVPSLVPAISDDSDSADQQES